MRGRVTLLLVLLLVGCVRPAATTHPVHVYVVNEAHVTARVNVTLHQPGYEDQWLELVAPLWNDTSSVAGPREASWAAERLVVGAHEETTGFNTAAEVFPARTPFVVVHVRDDGLAVETLATPPFNVTRQMP